MANILDSMIWTIKRGSAGSVRTGTLSDANGPIDLTNKTVTMSVRLTPTSAALIDDAAVTKAANQSTTGKGQISHTFTADEANIGVNLKGYLLEFKLTEGLVIDYIPLDRDDEKTYGRLIIQRSL